MAAFCKQCSIELFGFDAEDFTEGVTESQFLKEGLINIECCEGCGITETNHLGECVSLDCSKHGEDNKILFPALEEAKTN